MTPINYTLDVQQPFQAAMQGYQAGAAIRNDQQQQQAMLEQQRQQQLAAQQQAAMNADLSAASRDPRLLPQVMVRYPQLAKELKHGWDAMTAEQQNSQLSHAGQVLAAIESGRPDIAINTLRERATALRNGGDEQGAKAAEDMARLAEIDPAHLSNATLYRIAPIPGGDKIIKAIGDMREQRQKAELHGPAVRKAGADATTAEANAAYAKPNAEAAARKTAADATTAETTAKFSERNAVADLDIKGWSIKELKAKIGLSNAQAVSAAALAKKYSAETTIAVANAGTGDPAKRFEAETKLRGEFVKNTASAMDTREAYRRVQASRPDAVGDLSLIFGYMKMLDPGSVVREGEFANAQNAAGVPERVMNAYNRVAKGERLTEGQRKAFIAQAGDLNSVAERRVSEERERLMPVIKTYNLDGKNVFGEAREKPAEPPKPKPTTPAPGQVQDGYRFKGGNPADQKNWEKVR